MKDVISANKKREEGCDAWERRTAVESRLDKLLLQGFQSISGDHNSKI